jgi:hypothetical protein
MPSIRAVALIVIFWFSNTAYVAYRDLWPVLFASGPPPVAIDLADEAAQTIPVRWTIHMSGQKKPGRLTTLMKYHETDDTFAFTNRYTDLRYEAASAVVVVPELTSVVRVTRGGDLREQTVDGRIELFLGDARVGEAKARVAGHVTAGELRAAVDAEYSFAGMRTQRLERTLDPVPVPVGQPLNPLQPVNRLTDLRPGRRWVVHESNPLEDAVAAVVKEQAGQFGLVLPEGTRERLYGEVLAELRTLEWNGEAVPCRVIEYRRQEPVARTWVRASDGKVLKQEAFRKGEALTIVRNE